MSKRALSIDFGGTGLRAGVFDEKELLKQKRIDISKVDTNDQLDRLVLGLCQEVLEASSTSTEDLIGIGMGGAGTWEGLNITFAPNSPIRHNIRFPTTVQEHFDKPALYGNDIKVAVHGAALYGHGKGRDLASICAITFSTGNNIGILYMNRPYPGYSDLSQEVGHSHIEHDERNARWCGCGSQGCFEAYVSGTAAANMAKERLIAAKNQLEELAIYQVAKRELEREAGTDLTPGQVVWNLKAEHAYQALREHPDDKIANWICETQKFYIAHELAHVSVQHRPQLIVLYGGMTNSADLIFHPAIKDLNDNPAKYAWADFKPPEIMITKLGDDIGLYGGAGMIFYADKAGELRRES